ncbi:hypothetical protein ES703_121638 [subsurface metagenome]
MGNYKIRIRIGISDPDQEGDDSVNVEFDLTEEQACSIDAVEKAVLNLN